jgi:hypothetical protein
MHRFGVSPEPGQRPEQAAENQREQAQTLDGFGLRVLFFLGDFLGRMWTSQKTAMHHQGRRQSARPSVSTSAILSSASPLNIEACEPRSKPEFIYFRGM